MNSEPIPYTDEELHQAYSADTIATEARARAVLRYAGRLWIVTAMMYVEVKMTAEAVSAVPETHHHGKRCSYQQRCAQLSRMECRHPAAATLRRHRFYEGLPAHCGPISYRMLRECRHFVAGAVVVEQAELFGPDA